MPPQDRLPTEDHGAASDQRAPEDPSGGDARATRTYRQIRFVAPADATEIVLVRHGESAPADPQRPFPLVDGRGDPELSPNGWQQAERVATRLASSAISAVYVTSLRRTAETAAPLTKQLGLEPAVEPDLSEVHLGAWEGGLYRQRIAEADPLAMQIFEQERWDLIPGAETNDAVGARVRGAIDRIAARHRGARVAVFAHGGTIGATLALATGSRPFAFIGSDNGAISTIFVTGERWLLRGFNDRSHLD